MGNHTDIPDKVISAIDFMRGIFALFIAIGHTYDIAKTSSQPVILSLEESIRACFGFQWVIGFFVISGFCIERSCQNTSTQHFLRNYATARFTRLAPLYYTVIFITIIFELIMFQSEYRPAYWTKYISFEGVITQVFFLQGAGLLTAAFGSFASSYTITHEVFYYIYWGIFRRQIQLARGSISMPQATLLSAVIFYVGYLLLTNTAYPLSLIFYYGLPWLIGVLVYQHYHSLVNQTMVRNICSVWPLFLILILSGYAFGWVTQKFWFLILAIIFSMMIIQANEKTSCYSRLGNLPRFLGYLSYPLFLVHGPIAMFIAFVINHAQWRLEFHFLFFILISSAVAGATLVVYSIEKPWLIFRSRWLSGRFNRETLY
ncbi:acyltransferase family protein [Candidatus Nitrospira salsa]